MEQTYTQFGYYVAGMTGEAIFQVYDQDEIDSMIPKTLCRAKENVVINDDLYFNEGKCYPAKRINNVEQGSYQVFCVKRNILYGMIYLGKEEFDKYFVYLS